MAAKRHSSKRRSSRRLPIDVAPNDAHLNRMSDAKLLS